MWLCDLDSVIVTTADKFSTEIFEMLKAFSEHSLGQTHISVWHAHFSAGRMSVQDEH